ncbi:MAG: hypothetical protein Q8T09_06385 [Candidatus Melainabacteria bacterium]|nr:hypothetical protein [Candidatus Melainabacteria bacterium]
MNNTESQEAVFARAWKAFQQAVKNDNAAADMIYRSLRSDGRIKCSCSKPKITRKRGQRFYLCMNCKKKYWFTSGTLFEGACRLRAWLAAVWFKESGVAISSSALAKLLDIAQSTALNMQKKVSLVLYRQMDDNTSSLSIERLIDSIIKRSKDTPASCHPSAEVELEREADGSSLAGDADDQFAMPMSISAPLAGQIIYFLRQYFHGVSRKYLQLYVVAFCCFRPESKWEKRTILRACLQHPPIKYGELLEFSSPSLLKVEGF